MVHALDAALIALREIDAAFVEEADHHGLRIVGAEANGQAGPVATHAHVVPGHGHRRQLQVVDVDPDRVAPHHERALEHPGHPARVARGGDERALLEPRGPGLGQADRELGADVDVGDALHALGAEQGARPAGFPHDGGVDLGGGLDDLVGIDLDVAAHLGVGADQAALADDRTGLDPRPHPEVARPPQHRSLHPGRRSQVGVLADDRTLELGPRRHLGVGAHRGIGPDHHALVDGAVLADEGRRVDAGRGVDGRALADPDAGAELEARHVHLDLPVEDVLVRLEVGRGRADVLPVAVGHVAVERLTGIEDGREDLAGEVDRPAVGDAVEDLGLEDVDARVDGVAEHLAPARLLEEALDRPVLTRDHDPELEGVLHRTQGDGGQRLVLLVEGDHRREVDVGEDVTGDHEKALGQLLACVADRSGGAERRLLGGVHHGDPELAAVTEIAADGVGQEGDRDDDVGDPVAPQQRHDVLHHRTADEGEHRFGQIGGLRAEPGALATGHDHGLHTVLRRAARPSRRARRAGAM